ncbi:MAG: hypothetical protein KL787_04510 [Taibaiella sp.]|nr:hypothetical protein [Taibaiella sp.]
MKKTVLQAACLLLLAVMISCSSKMDTYPEGYEEGDEYFSMKEFFDDQWKNKSELPYVYAKVTKVNDVVEDSVIMDWTNEAFAEIREEFEKADIGAPGHLGKYNFTLLEDMNSRTLLYEALDKDAFTQKLILVLDAENNKITSVYAETKDEGIFSTENSKMTYIPDGTIQIVKFRKHMFSKKKEIIITYKFL